MKYFVEGIIKGDTRGCDYSSDEIYVWCVHYSLPLKQDHNLLLVVFFDEERLAVGTENEYRILWVHAKPKISK